MEKLKELISIVNRNKVKGIEIIGQSSKENTLLNKLYYSIQDGDIKTDKEAQKILYPNKPNKNAYYKLKFTLKERLLNTLLFINHKTQNLDDRKKAFLECQRKNTILIYLNNLSVGKKTAFGLAGKVLKEAMYWQFVDIVISSARFLRAFHMGKTGDRKQINHYSEIIDNYTELYIAEIKVETLYGTLITQYVNNRSPKEHLFEITNKYSIILQDYIPKVKSARFIYMKSMIEVIKYMSINDYTQTVVICKETLKSLEDIDYTDTRSVIVINYQLIASYIQIKEYEAGEVQINYLLSVVKKYTFNWFKTYELYIHLAIHQASYRKAWEILKEATQSPNLKKLPEGNQNSWRVYEAWLYFILSEGLIDDSINTRDSKFKVGKFINEVNVFTKDKKGLNIPILTVYLLFLIQQKRYNTLINKLETITKYTYRHLNEEITKRSYHFISMLLLVIKHDFDRTIILPKIQVHLEALDTIPIATQNYGIEVMPYKVLWQLITTKYL